MVETSKKSHQQLEEHRSIIQELIIAQNDGLAIDHDYALYEKQLNDLQLKFLQNMAVDLDQDDVAKLEFVAYKCPLEGGNAVYRARAMLKAQGDYDFAGIDCTLPAQNDLQGNVQDPRETTANVLRPAGDLRNTWTVYPNPAQNYVQLYGKDIAGVEAIRLLDINGKLQTRWFGLSQGRLQLPAHLVDGLYFLSIQQLDGTVETIKLIISH